MTGDPVQRVAAQLGVSRPMIWRWQQRFAEAGVDGLLRDKTRKPGKPPIAAETVARVVALTCADPPHQATHWTGRAMAKAAGISLSSAPPTGRRWSSSSSPRANRKSRYPRRLTPMTRGRSWRRSTRPLSNQEKFFGSFFQKKNRFLRAILSRARGGEARLAPRRRSRAGRALAALGRPLSSSRWSGCR